MNEDQKRKGLALVQGAATELRDEIAALQAEGERLRVEQARIELEIASLAAQAATQPARHRTPLEAVAAMLAKLRGASSPRA